MEGQKPPLKICLLFFFAALSDGVLAQINQNCTFPSIMNLDHDNSVDHTWRFLSPDPTFAAEHSTGQWQFQMHSVYISHGRNLNDYNSVDGYDYDCIERVSDFKVLVKRIEITADESPQDKFACIEFVPRSVAVVQLQISDYVNVADASLCGESRLQNNDTTLVHFHSAMWYKVLEEIPYMSCGLEGGYAVDNWFDQEGVSGCTSDMTNSLRIEDECDTGSGFHISGETDGCPTPLETTDMYKRPLTCIAKWKDTKYTYSIATDEWNSFFVCLRVPLQRGRQFTMHIFLDGTCDSTEEITHSKKYRKLNVNQFVVSDICGDYLPRCSLLSKEDCIGPIPNLCRETCGICPKDRPWHGQSLPEKILGDWYMQIDSKPGRKVTIGKRAIEFPVFGSWRYFGESACERYRIGHQKKAQEYTFFSSSVQGCLPRVATIMINTFSESVIGVQLSQSAPSKLEEVDGLATWSEDMATMCDDTKYFQDKGRLRDKYHTAAYGWQNLVKVADYPRLSQCKIEEEQKVVFKLKSGEECKGTLYLRKLGDSFDMELNDCGKDNNTADVPGGLKSKVRYECMAKFNGANDWDSYIITRTPGEVKNLVNETYVCWYLPGGKHGYFMPISSCDDMTDAEISLDEKEPLARVELISPEENTNSASNCLSQFVTIVLLFALTFI